MQAHLVYLFSTTAPSIVAIHHFKQKPTIPNVSWLNIPTKYSHREVEECIIAVFSFLTQQVLMHICLELNVTTDIQTVQQCQHFPEICEIIYKNKELSKCFIYTLSICKNNIINGRVNKFKNSMKAFLAFTQDLPIKALM